MFLECFVVLHFTMYLSLHPFIHPPVFIGLFSHSALPAINCLFWLQGLTVIFLITVTVTVFGILGSAPFNLVPFSPSLYSSSCFTLLFSHSTLPKFDCLFWFQGLTIISNHCHPNLLNYTVSLCIICSAPFNNVPSSHHFFHPFVLLVCSVALTCQH